jgi:hypothetical protein
MLSIDKGARSEKIHNMIMSTKRSSILTSNMALPGIGKDTMCTIFDYLTLSLLSDNSIWNHQFTQLEACLCDREASCIWAVYPTIIIWFLPDICCHILGWWWDDVIHRQMAATTTPRGLGPSCAMRCIATINKAKSVQLLNFFTAIPHLAAVLLSKLSLIHGAYCPPPPLGSSR